MSQSSNSTMNKNNSSVSITTIKDDNKITATSAERGAKRAAPDQLEGQVKKVMVHNHSREERVSNPGPSVQQKFVSAAEIAANSRTSVQMMPEISDEELLEMAIQFEMKHPQ